MYSRKILQNAYLKLTCHFFDIPVSLEDLDKELKDVNTSYSVVDLIDKLLDDFVIKFSVELLMFPDWCTNKKLYKINNEYYTHIRIKNGLCV